jgi:hypothetical protein
VLLLLLMLMMAMVVAGCAPRTPAAAPYCQAALCTLGPQWPVTYTRTQIRSLKLRRDAIELQVVVLVVLLLLYALLLLVK